MVWNNYQLAITFDQAPWRDPRPMLIAANWASALQPGFPATYGVAARYLLTREGRSGAAPGKLSLNLHTLEPDSIAATLRIR
jgi:hypothetical protein